MVEPYITAWNQLTEAEKAKFELSLLKNFQRKLEKRLKEEDKKTCRQLQHLFHMAMLMGFLPNLNTKDKMMDYLNTSGNTNWHWMDIWHLAYTNQIGWVKDSIDRRPYESYKEAMNKRLAEILRPPKFK